MMARVRRVMVQPRLVVIAMLAVRRSNVRAHRVVVEQTSTCQEPLAARRKLFCRRAVACLVVLNLQPASRKFRAPPAHL